MTAKTTPLWLATVFIHPIFIYTYTVEDGKQADIQLQLPLGGVSLKRHGNEDRLKCGEEALESGEKKLGGVLPHQDPLCKVMDG